MDSWIEFRTCVECRQGIIFFLVVYMLARKGGQVLILKKAGHTMIGKKSGSSKSVEQKQFNNVYNQKSPLEK